MKPAPQKTTLPFGLTQDEIKLADSAAPAPATEGQNPLPPARRHANAAQPGVTAVDGLKDGAAEPIREAAV